MFFLERALSDQITGIVSLPCAPQALQIVEFARARGKNVNHEIDVVHKDPFAFGVSFDMKRARALLLERFLDVIRNGLVVTCRCSGADEKGIGEGANVAQFENNRILGFFVEGRFDRFG